VAGYEDITTEKIDASKITAERYDPKTFEQLDTTYIGPKRDKELHRKILEAEFLKEKIKKKVVKEKNWLWKILNQSTEK